MERNRKIFTLNDMLKCRQEPQKTEVHNTLIENEFIEKKSSFSLMTTT